MKKPYQAIVWVRDLTDGAWSPMLIGSFRSHVRAERCVRNSLTKRYRVITTRGCYHRDVARANYGEVRNAKRPELCGETINAPVEIVPSVGELGYW